MTGAEEIPVEIRARVEAGALFESVRVGDYAGAARAQERLRALGWRITREPTIRRRDTRQRIAAADPGVV